MDTSGLEYQLLAQSVGHELPLLQTVGLNLRCVTYLVWSTLPYCFIYGNCPILGI